MNTNKSSLAPNLTGAATVNSVALWKVPACSNTKSYNSRELTDETKSAMSLSLEVMFELCVALTASIELTEATKSAMSPSLPVIRASKPSKELTELTKSAMSPSLPVI